MKLRIFISSPGDVSDERDKARRVIDGLQRHYTGATLQPVLWEDLALPATSTFQETIEVILQKEPIDIAVFILWSRLGTPLGPPTARLNGTPYLSGTEREFELMLAAFDQSGKQRPVILAYTRKDDSGFRQTLDASPLERVEELMSQWKLAESFIREQFKDAEGHNVRAYHSYREPVNFAQRLHTHLRQVLDELLGADASPRWLEEPYRGLEVFDVEHAPIFQGRDEETCEILQRLRDQEQTGCAFAVIVGASGSGKSSLARAGVAAALMHHSYDERVKAWRVVTFFPGLGGSELNRSLVRALAEQLPELRSSATALDDIANGLAKDATLTVNLSIKPAFARAAESARGSVRILLLIDQMEELWTDRRITDEDRQQFLDVLEALARSGHIAVLSTLRSDFYPHAQRIPAFLRLKGDRGHYDLLPPGAAALHRLITEPARLAGLQFEREPISRNALRTGAEITVVADAASVGSDAGSIRHEGTLIGAPVLTSGSDQETRIGKSLDEQILQDASRDPTALPLLQYALSELYQQRDASTRTLTFAAYQSLGGVEGALGKRAAETFQSLPPDVRAALPEILPLLVTIDIAGEQSAVRRRAPLAELTATPARRSLTESLIAARFLSTDRQDDTPIASLAHEALLRRWDELAQWVASNREHLRLRTRVEQNQRHWEQHEQDSSLLLPAGLSLEEGRQLLNTTNDLLRSDTTSYIRESIAHHEVEEARNRKRRRTVIAAMTALTLLALVGATVAWFKQREAFAAQYLAQESAKDAKLAENSVSTLAGGAFDLARVLGDADLDSAGRLNALDKQLDAVEKARSKGTRNIDIERWLVAIQHGRCKVQRHLDLFREATLSGTEARSLLEKQLAVETSTEVRTHLVEVLQDLGDTQLDQGHAKLAKECYQASLKHMEELGPVVDQDAKLLLLRCLGHRKMGRYYTDIGNPWLASVPRKAALKDAQSAHDKDKSDIYRIELANTIRLVAQSESDLASASLLGTENGIIKALVEAQRLEELLAHTSQVFNVLGSTSRPGKVTRRWLETRFNMAHTLASNYQANGSPRRAAEQREEAIKCLERLQILEPSHPEWIMYTLQQRINTVFYSEAGPTRFKDNIRDLDLIRMDADDLARQYPENMTLASHSADWGCALLLINAAGQATDVERTEFLNKARQHLAVSENALRTCLRDYPESINFTHLLGEVLLKQAEVTNDPAQQKQLRLAAHQLKGDFYQARLKEEPESNHVTWRVLINDTVAMEAMELGLAAMDLSKANQPKQAQEQWGKAAARYSDAAKEYEAICAIDPDNHFWMSRLAEAISMQVGASSSSNYKSRAAIARACQLHERELELRQRCCELTTGATRMGYRSKLDDVFNRILDSVRDEDREVKLGKTKTPGPYFQRFGTVDALLRSRRTESDRFMTDEVKSPSPLKLNPASLSDEIARLRSAPHVTAIYLKQLEEDCRNARTDIFNYDDPLVDDCVDRIPWLRLEAYSAGKPDTNSKEVMWMLRAAHVSLIHIHQHGGRSAWLSAMKTHIDEEVAALTVPSLPWAEPNPSNDWASMNYVALGRTAKTNDKLPEWCDFMNAEFTAAAKLEKSIPAPLTGLSRLLNSEPAAPTWAEDFVYRQLLDNLFLDPDLCQSVLAIAKERLDSGKKLQSRFRSVLGTLAYLRDERALAKELDPAINDKAVSPIRMRIVRNALQLRQFAALQVLLKMWCQGSNRELVDRALLDYTECEHQLGNTTQALDKVEEFIRKIPTNTSVLMNMRLRFLLDQYRDSADLESKLGGIGVSSPDEDLIRTLVAAYVNVRQTKTVESVKKLAALANRPDCELRSWAFELVGDAYQIIKKAEEARKSFQAALDEFPPTTANDDIAFVRTKRKLAGLAQ